MSGRRDFEKMRRRERATRHDDYSRRRFGNNGRLISEAEIDLRPGTKPDTEMFLVVSGGDGGEEFRSISKWVRRCNRWRCVEADESCNWMMRVRNPEVVLDWIHAKRFQYRWQKTSSPDSNGRGDQDRAGEHPAEPSSSGCAPKGDEQNGAIVNKDSKVATRGPTPGTPTLLLAQNGSSVPRCLIAKGCPLEQSPEPSLL